MGSVWKKMKMVVETRTIKQEPHLGLTSFDSGVEDKLLTACTDDRQSNSGLQILTLSITQVNI